MVFFQDYVYDGDMNGSIIRWLMGMRAGDLLGTLWPGSTATDSEFQRRRKVAVRSAQLSALALVVVAITGAIANNFANLSGLRVTLLLSLGLAYAAWNVIGTRDMVRVLLWEPGSPPLTQSLQERKGRAFFYFAIQMALAGLIYSLIEPSPKLGFLWLILLPPVAHSVILLRAPGIGIISTLGIAIFGVFFVRWHGWELLPNALLAFGFAVLFTLIFTLLAVSSETSRGEVQRLACELSEANGKLREYAVQVEELAVTRERNRLAREIHDTLGHYLTVVNVQIEAARAMLDRDPEKVRDSLQKAQSLTQEGLQDIRRSVSALRASPLDNRNLEEALRLAVETVRVSGLNAELELIGTCRPLSRPAELALYRAAQEGLTNVQKHAQATHVHLVLDFSEATRTRLTVTDNGVGSIETTGHGFGLLGLRERTHLVGGALNIRSTPSAGFALEVEVPG